MNLLSIDWDYFMDASVDERHLLFPDGGNEELPAEILAFVWVSRYSDSIISVETGKCSRSISDIGVLDGELRALYEVIGAHCSSDVKMVVAESHKEIVSVIDELYRTSGEAINVFNVDYHHDSYDHTTKGIDCGNWVRQLKEAGKIGAVTWVRREDSDDSEAMLDFETLWKIEDLHNSRLIQENGIDVVFVCRSGAWSPLHLDEDFVEMLDCIQTEFSCSYDVVGQLLLRWNDYTQSSIREMVEKTRQFYVKGQSLEGAE